MTNLPEYEYEFYWRDKALCPERKQAILRWLQSLTLDQKKMVDELLNNAKMEERYLDADEE